MSQQQQQQKAREMIEQQQGPNQIVRIQSDTETNLDELFKAVIGPKGNNQMQMGVPMRLRNLPPSFFQQPERGSRSASHSRESSTDNTSYSSPPPPHPQKVSNPQQAASNAQHPSGLSINHPRAHSSPASLQQTYSNNTAQHQHLRQQSYDITDDLPLPPGWEMAKTPTGQLYFLNHLTKTTTWDDPRKKLSAGSLSSTSSAGPTSPVLSLQNIGPLPDGWEQATTAEGEIYFINHKTRTTSWYDPRIPIHLQQPPLVPISSHGISTQQIMPVPQMPIQASAITSTGSNSSIPGPLTLQQQQQNLRLQRLQKERERLKIRAQEILRQSSSFGNPMLNEMMMRHTLREEGPVTTSPTSSTSDIQSSSHTSIDPFLGGSDYHSRQESADSGLGLGTNYSLPNTPEDYLISMDEGGETNSDITSELNLESIQASTLDLGTENMDSDDLVPSLQEELNADILSNVEALLGSNKDTVMKWL